MIDIVRLGEYDGVTVVFSIFWREKMIDGYMNISEASSKWGVSTRRVQVLCKQGRIAGASKFGREWAIPIDADKPRDNRFVSGKYVAWRKKGTTQLENSDT